LLAAPKPRPDHPKPPSLRQERPLAPRVSVERCVVVLLTPTGSAPVDIPLFTPS